MMLSSLAHRIAIKRTVRALDPVDRTVLLALRIDGATYGAIAASTGLTEREVEASVARSIAAIDRACATLGRPWWRRWLG